jgi:hypothetical protein
MESKAMRRAMRSARAVLHGTHILEFIQRPETRQKLIAAADAGAPPVTAISSQVVKLAGRDAKLPPVKQFVGLCIRAVLEQEGFQAAAKGVRVSKDPIFRTGSTYERKPAAAKGRVFFARMVEALTDQEADELLALLQRRTPKTRT